MGPKKKLSKKEKMRLAAEKAEQERIEMEKERQRLIQEEKDRVERERLEAEEKTKRDIADQSIRVKELQETDDLFISFKEKMYKLKLENRANEEWTQYMKCDGLPNPASLGEMNTYLFLWRSSKEQGDLTELVQKTKEVIAMLEVMQELIDVPLDNSKKNIENWKQVRNDFRMELQKCLNRATYLILRKMEENMKLKDAIDYFYKSTFDHFILCLWTLLPLPPSLQPIPKSERVPLKCEFSEVGVTVNLPDSLFDVLLAIRALLVRYDHLSDLCPSFYPNALPEQEAKGLYEMCLVEWEAKCEFQVIVDAENERRAQIAARVAAIKPVSSSQEDTRRGKKDKEKQAAQAAAFEAEILELQQLQATPVKPASEMYSEKEDEIQSEVKAQLLMKLKPYELNLRKYMILGGVYHLDLVQQPPQPLMLHDLTIFTVLSVPTELQPVDFHEKYVPPPPPEPGQRRLPEEIEAELKKQEEELEKLALASVEKSEKENEEKGNGKKEGKDTKKDQNAARDDAKSKDTPDFDFSHLKTALPTPNKEEVVIEEKEVEDIIDSKLFELCFVELKLPAHVLWFEPPVIAGWNEQEGFWSTEDFHDLKFNEEKQIITFRSGKFGPVGLAAYRYVNLPYQTWELKPYHKGEGVCFSITAAVMIVEFIIKDDKVCVNQLQNGVTEALQEIVGNYYTPYQLRKLLCNGGVDLFPAHDAHCYIDGATPKHRAAEDHLYHCMALLSTSHNFAWSRWNLLAGRRNLVLQIKEFVDKKKQCLQVSCKHKSTTLGNYFIKSDDLAQILILDYSLLLVTPLKACIVECTEMSQSFSDEGIEGMNFYSDLYHLVLEQGSLAAKARINEIPFTLVETVFEMLVTTRVLSFS